MRPPDSEKPAGEAGFPGDSTDRAVRRADSTAPEPLPQFRSRRAFLTWAVMAGFAKPERLTERVLDELEREGRE